MTHHFSNMFFRYPQGDVFGFRFIIVGFLGLGVFSNTINEKGRVFHELCGKIQYKLTSILYEGTVNFIMLFSKKTSLNTFDTHNYTILL